MSFFGLGGRPQLSSEQKIAQAEAEIDMVSDMYSRYVSLSPHVTTLPFRIPLPLSTPHISNSSTTQHHTNLPIGSSNPAPQNA